MTRQEEIVKQVAEEQSKSKLYEQDDNDVVKVSSWEYDNLEDFMFSFRIKLEE